MLVEFRLRNFRSFRDEEVISFVASTDKIAQENIVELEDSIDVRLLRSLVVYGANASGKTTLLDALAFVQDFVRNSAKKDPDEQIDVQPFMLDQESRSKPIGFELIFIQGGVRYQFGFEVKENKIFREWLLSYPKGRPRRLFDRHINHDSYDYSFSTYLKGEKERLVELTKPNTLFLSVGATFKNEQLLNVVNWFSEKLMGVQADRISENVILDRMTKSVEYVGQIRKLLRFADLGIVDFSVDDAPDSVQNLLKAIRVFMEEVPSDKRKKFIVNMLHRAGRENIPFPMHMESAGTRQLFSLSVPILDALSEGKILFVDEIDSSLHPLLVHALVKLFHNPSINNKFAQLLFNTHDTTLLNLAIFRRDQVWFVEKDQFGASHLYSLLDYSPRKGEALEKGYLQGRYGAIPFVGELPKDLIAHG
jgi:AAA15 family ATPase/GTPase